MASQLATEPYPSPANLPAATSSHTQRHFKISTRKLPISKAGPIEALEQSLGIPVPEMIFGDNVVEIAHLPSGWRLRFDARDALDAVDKHGENMLQVAYARDWSRSREQTSAGIKEVVKPYDWSYSTSYRGTLVMPPAGPGQAAPGGAAGQDGAGMGGDGAMGTDGASEAGRQGEGSSQQSSNGTAARRGAFTAAATPIPLELLKRRDPILFFDDVMLYESELDDNGISICSVKVRVHEHRMLLLCRLFMRLDNVVLRIRDTRVYVDFDADLVIREYTSKEDSFNNVKRALFMSGRLPDDVTVALRDPNILSDMLPKVEQRLEAVSLAE